jgi:hypothetical protein
MTHFDVFNGDADGLCALHQLRLVFPTKSVLITGVKRDIALLKRIKPHKGDSITVLDISFEVNRPEIFTLLQKGVEIDYFDHHECNFLPIHTGLRTYIDTSPTVCTAILVDQFLSGRYRLWTIVGAFGDNLIEPATTLSKHFSLNFDQQRILRQLGFYLNYNSYADTEDDLIIHPADLYQRLHHYADPFEFVLKEAIVEQLRSTYTEDIRYAMNCDHYAESTSYQIIILPDERWSHRIRGAFANTAINKNPNRACAILSNNKKGGYTVSVRVPRLSKVTAGQFCKNFVTGGGRATAGGINNLDITSFDEFVQLFQSYFQKS